MTGDGGGVDGWEGDSLEVRGESGGEDVVGRVRGAAVGPVGEGGFVWRVEERVRDEGEERRERERERDEPGLRNQ